MRPVAATAVLMLAGAFSAFAQSGAPTVTAVNGAAIVPGSLISVYGSNLASALAVSDTTPLSASLAGVSVTINNTSAPVQLVSGGQVNVQVPWGLAPTDPASPAQLVVTNNGTGSAPLAVPVVTAAPSLFEIDGQAIAANPDGTLAAPPGLIPGIGSRAAKVGDMLIIMATGLGAVDSPIDNGANSMDKQRNTLSSPTVLIGGVAAQVTFSGLAPSMVGIYQINATIAAGTPTGNAVTLQIQMNGASSNPATIAVSQ